MSNKPDMMLWLSDARGVYIPRDFAQSFADRVNSVAGVDDEQWAILELGPDYQDAGNMTVYNELYWDVWTEVCDSAIVTNNHGVKFRIYQDGDCWLIPEGMDWCADGRQRPSRLWLQHVARLSAQTLCPRFRIAGAQHPNGYSCYELLDRMAKREIDRAVEQAKYILDCGGTARHMTHIINSMSVPA